MNKLLFATALAGVAFGVTNAGAKTITYDSYSTPDSEAFNSVTTTANNAPDTPYSYYTGPISFALHEGGTLLAYCVDLNDILRGSGTFYVGVLDHNGANQQISEFDSNRIGHIAALGFAALQFNDTQHLDLAAAAQAAIWDIAYGIDNASSFSTTPFIEADLNNFLSDHFADTGFATAFIPNDGYANQMMVGVTTSVPEPSSWALMLSGFGLMGLAGVYHKRKSASVAASA